MRAIQRSKLVGTAVLVNGRPHTIVRVWQRDDGLMAAEVVDSRGHKVELAALETTLRRWVKSGEWPARVR